jgi:hypothetical protein
MTAFVEECRREWKRLGVPDLMAEEMATDLEADLAEAEADGVSAAEMLGESDPRSFAASWARERGLVPAEAPRRNRRRVWPWVVLAVVLVVGFFVSFAAVGAGTRKVVSAPVLVTPPRRAVPNFVGLNACTAVRTAVRADLEIHLSKQERDYGCHAVVARQRPAAGHVIGRERSVTLRLSKTAGR